MGATSAEGVGRGAVNNYQTQVLGRTVSDLEDRITVIEENGSVDSTPIILTAADDETTLDVAGRLYIVHIDHNQFVSVAFPDVETMYGKQLIFVGAFEGNENGFDIYGNIAGSDTHWTLTAGATVRFISDGTTWWES